MRYSASKLPFVKTALDTTALCRRGIHYVGEVLLYLVPISETATESTLP